MLVVKKTLNSKGHSQ